MKEQSKYEVISIVLAIVTISFSWKKEFLSASIITGAIAIVFTYLTFYIKQIKENTEKNK